MWARGQGALRHTRRAFCALEKKDGAALQQRAPEGAAPVVAVGEERKPFRGGNSIEDLLVENRRREFLAEYPDANIDRYLPPSDPYAFLVDKEKLTPSERRWQGFFVALPWAVFVSMVATPFLLLRYHLGRMDEKKGGGTEESVAPTGAAPSNAPNRRRKQKPCCGLEELKFTEMADLIEATEMALVMMHHPQAYRTALCVPFLRDLGVLLRKHEVPVRLVALDLSTVSEEEDGGFRAAYPPVLAPHIHAIVPQSGGEPAVHEARGVAAVHPQASALLAFLEQFVKLPKALVADAERLDAEAADAEVRLHEASFLDDGAARRSGAPAGRAPDLDLSQGLRVVVESLMNGGSAAPVAH